MTIWMPDLSLAPGPKYRALADAIALAIEDGSLTAGARLPPQRELAYRLSMTLGTVTRAYELAERRGLVSAEVGRGTFVRAQRQRPRTAPAAGRPDLLDLTINEPADRSYRAELAGTLAELAGEGAALGELLPYTPRAGLPQHRAAAAEWLARAGLDADPERLLITGGAHQAIVTALAALARPGDAVLADALSYSGLRAIATSLHLQLEPVGMDEAGLRPEALDAACRASGARVLFTNPTLHNPTATTLSAERRDAVVAIARARDLVIVEDDVYGLLRAERPAPLAALAPERTVHVTGAAKTLAPGLRVGLLLSPPALYEPIANAKYDLFLCQPALMAEVFTRWLSAGTADRLLARQREEAGARQAVARQVLGAHGGAADPCAFHLWLTLPAPWRAGEFADAARERGVAVAPGPSFAVGRSHAPHAVRISLSAAPDRESLHTGLEVLRGLLEEAPAPRRGLI